MDSIKVKELLKGVVVIIDDDVKKEKTSIYKLREQIEKDNIPVISYEQIPQSELVESLHNASIIILDWKFSPQSDLQMGDDKLYGASSLQHEIQEEVIQFIRSVCDNLLVPIFIFTSELVEVVQGALHDNGLERIGNDRIFIERKDNISDLDSLYQRIGTWMMDKPSAYVLKEWDRAFCKARNEMFIEMYSASPEWVRIIWDMIKKDSGGENVNCHREFEEFLTRSIVNRIYDIDFDVSCLQEHDFNAYDDSIMAILEAERYIEYGGDYKKGDISAHTGDLFQNAEGTYYLNVRAECDLARNKKVELYCLRGKEIDETNILLEDIQITDRKKLKIAAKEYELREDCAADIREALISYRNKRIFHMGAIIEKVNEVIIPCVAGKKLIQFKLDIKIKKFSELKETLKGRLLPPYINRVQQRCANYIVRTGTLPIPPGLFETYDGYCQ